MERIRFEDGTILYIEDIVLAKLFKYLQRSSTSKEAGGILIGKQAKGREEYYLCDVSEPSHMDKKGRFSFVRNKVSAQRIINKKWHESNGIENYLGEWHSHTVRLTGAKLCHSIGKTRFDFFFQPMPTDIFLRP